MSLLSVDVQRDRPAPLPQRARVLQALREARRARNREDESVATRCECARVDCRVRLPLDVERHRRGSWRFIVAPSHAGADTIVGAADRFFVVEATGCARVAAPALRDPGKGTALPRTPHQGSVERLLRDTPGAASPEGPSRNGTARPVDTNEREAL